MRLTHPKFYLVPALLAAVAMILGCADGNRSTNDSTNNPQGVPFQELYDQGIDRYLGTFSPMSSEQLEDRVTLHRYGVGSGPLCFTGNEFSMSTRDGLSEELMIFLQGGGACGPTNCASVDVPWPILDFGILDAKGKSNPAADFDLGYVPYCDGTFFTGDRDVDSDGDGSNDRFFRGLQNLSASLDVIVSTYPAPSRILLAGNSAGGLGVHYALPLVRKLYPDVPIALLNDSGMGIQQPGTQEVLSDYWNAGAFFPASCRECIAEDGNLTNYHKYQLDQDANLRMGFISSTADEVIVDRSGITPAAFGAELIAAMAELEQAHPARFRSLISNTEEHTYIIKQFGFRVADTSVRQWITDMLNASDNWVSIVE